MESNTLKILKCPSCGNNLENCGHTVPKTENGALIFMENFEKNEVKSHNSKQSTLKSVAKKILLPPHHSIYNDLSSSHTEPKELLSLLKKMPADAIIINIGSLSKNLQNLHKGIRNLDICAYPNIDFVADVCDLQSLSLAKRGETYYFVEMDLNNYAN